MRANEFITESGDLKSNLKPGDVVSALQPDNYTYKTGRVKRVGRTMIHVQFPDGSVHAYAPKHIGIRNAKGELAQGQLGDAKESRGHKIVSQKLKDIEARKQREAEAAKRKQQEQEKPVKEKTDPKLCRSKKRLGRSDHSSCVSQGLRPHQSKGKGHTCNGVYVKGKKIKGTKYGGPCKTY